MDGPSGLLFVALSFADLPFSAIALGVLMSRSNFGAVVAAFAGWGVVGTMWWYTLGSFIDKRRLRRRNAGTSD